MRQRLRIGGTVQGVGFRPFVYALASQLGLAGFVLNDSRGVVIEVEGDGSVVDAFTRTLLDDPPPLARLDSVEKLNVPPLGSDQFDIRASETDGAVVATITPDVATCAACLEETRDSSARRYGYAFTNCTNCGPRFTINIMPPEVMSRLHGAVRGLKAVTGQGPTSWREAAEPDQPEPTADALQGTDVGSDFESFLNGGAVNPEDDRIRVAGADIGKGSRVLLRPLRRADAQDIFVSGRSARVERILRDVDGETHVAVTLEDDPASDLHQWYGRFMYFSPDEVVPLAGEATHENDNE